LILIEEASLIGELLQSGSEILRVDKLMYIPLENPSVPITLPEQDKQFIDMMESLQKNHSFYFSYSLDLTKGIQTTLQELTKGG